MFILILVILITLVILFLLLGIKLMKWTFKSKNRIQVFFVLMALGVTGILINHFFLKDMRFIQSEVYPNLYLVKYPDENYSVVEEAIKEKIREHLKSEHKIGKKLSYTGENAIYFYELGGMTIGFLGDAGTGYFIDHEEDLGGFVSEELGMYINYRLAEFYYESCLHDSSLYCGEINFFREGEHHRVENLTNLISIDIEGKNPPDSQKKTNQDSTLPLHGLLDNEAVATYYPEILSEFDFNGNFDSKRIALTNDNEAILSLLKHTDSNSDYFLYSHDQNFKVIDSFYIGKAMDFDNGKSLTIDYKTSKDNSLVFNKVTWGSDLQDNQDDIDTLSHESIVLQVNQKGELEYSILKNPKYSVLEAYNRSTATEGIKLRDKPDGDVIQVLNTKGDGYIISIVSGENGWLRVLEIKSIEDGVFTIPQVIAWVHQTDLGIRANRETSVFDSLKTGKQIGIIPMDSDLNIIDLKQDWVKIEYQGLTGWVDSKSLCGNPVTTCF